MTRSGRASWSDMLVAGLVAVLAGREVFKEIRGGRSSHQTPTEHDRLDPAVDTSMGSKSVLRQDSQPVPEGVRLPRPSVWPMVLGGGLTLVLFGVVTSYAFIAIGVVLILGALGGWIGDLLYAGTD